MEKEVTSKIKESLPVKDKPQEKKRSACSTLLLGFLLGLFILFVLTLGGIALAISATGLVEVPVLSKVFKPPVIEEDFSYQTVPEKKLEAKLTALEGTEGPLNITLTDDEFNTILAPQFAQAQGTGTVKSVLIKFDPGIIKVSGVLSRNDAPFYLEIHAEKTAQSFEFSVMRARLGALPIPGALVSWVVGNLILGADVQPLGQPDPETFPVEELVIGEGTVTIKGLDLSGLFGPEDTGN